MGTIVILVGSLALGWVLLDVNVALLVWIGVGGMMAALAGPLLLGIFWPGVSRAGAIAGFCAGGLAFIILKAELLPAWGAFDWLRSQAPNSFACATLGQFASVAATIVVSKRTKALPREHLEAVFGKDTGTGADG